MKQQTASAIPRRDVTEDALESIVAICCAALDGKGCGDLAYQAPRLAGAAPAGEEPAVLSAAARAKRLYAARRRRDRIFGVHAAMIGDPVWDVMLDLFVAHHEGRKVSVSSACIAACVPPTTALRWIRSLERCKLVVRTPDNHDGRRQLVALSAQGLLIVEEAMVEF
ncbi:helix-turn-helix domain-containing protein [Sphingomonas qomolangmaensis]|uniref:MarR family transcriptional regulator n=1 Tax=Sphingomonas qomolangmaensis TaxID=2918765 RepID=A0ABY5L9B5_9SPHN|nr:MarR family transcriptional regulator [Sphingomonas qomolangmaensis]UUL82571.1 MarR family transcriptional regulator [Sphingomonas qomolangmaensis]